MDTEINNNYQHAIFAAGCFWCIQPFFDQTPGVISATVGYTGGAVSKPTYEQVCMGKTGHREAIDVVYDPSKVSYEKLLDIFWSAIDPTDAGGQYVDRGHQYTTAIYYLNDEQKRMAEESKRALEAKIAPKKVATAIEPAMEFYPAEDYHQAFYKKSPMRYQIYKEGSGRAH